MLMNWTCMKLAIGDLTSVTWLGTSNWYMRRLENVHHHVRTDLQMKLKPCI